MRNCARGRNFLSPNRNFFRNYFGLLQDGCRDCVVAQAIYSLWPVRYSRVGLRLVAVDDCIAYEPCAQARGLGPADLSPLFRALQPK